MIQLNMRRIPFRLGMIASLLLGMVLTLSSPASSTPTDAGISSLLRAKTAAFSEAGQRNDGDTMGAMLDDHVVFFNEGGDRASKADMAASVPAERPSGIATKMAIEDWQCEVHGDVAVASFIDNQDQNFHGQPFHARYRSVETWMREKGGWRMIASETIALVDDPKAVSLPPSTLQEYVGNYEAAPGVDFTFAMVGGQLVASANGGPSTPQMAEVRDVLFTPGRSRAKKVFERDSSGQVTGFLLRREGHDIRFERKG
jgi:ketosteroid isomerase-like protein